MMQVIQMSDETIPVTSMFSIHIDTLELKPNVYLLSGKNGSGKSVFLRYLVQSGAYVNREKKILYLTDEEISMPYLTMKENVQLACQMFGITQLANYSLFDATQLSILSKQASLGMRHKVGLSLVLVECFWDMIILDESLSNLDVDSTGKVLEALSKRSKEGTIVILVDHQMDERTVDVKQLYIEEGSIYVKK